MRPHPAAIAAAIIACYPFPSSAYIDPGTGSMLLQSALAAIAAVLVFGRSAWTRLKDIFRRRGKEQPPPGRDPDSP